VVDDPVSWDDPDWTPWLDWPETGSPEISLAGLAIHDAHDQLFHYFIALQAKDADGLVSDGREYALDVHNFHIADTLAPTLTLREPDLGTHISAGEFGRMDRDIAPHQPLRFTWLASAESYGEEIVWYRWGWDLQDPTDPGDPGWGVQPGLGPEHLAAPERSFTSGIHIFTVQCADTHGGFTRTQVFLDVILFPSHEDKRPLLLIDDVRDIVSNAWPDESGIPHDNDVYRDARWHQLLGDVVGFNPERDVIDNEIQEGAWGLRELAEYKAVIWATRFNRLSYIAQNFYFRFIDVGSEEDPVFCPSYIWLDAYQRYGGNLLLVGAGATTNFHITDSAGYVSPRPIFYDATGPDLVCNGHTWQLGFGDYVYPDGTTASLGTLLHPYRSLGVSVLDNPRPLSFYGHDDQFDDCISGTDHRQLHCVGTKALALDGDFRDAHGVGGAIPTEITTSPVIDWQDQQYDIPPLDQIYVFGQYDEFYDTNITGLPAEWSPQTHPDGGPMLEPMWRLHSLRLDPGAPAGKWERRLSGFRPGRGMRARRLSRRHGLG